MKRCIRQFAGFVLAALVLFQSVSAAGVEPGAFYSDVSAERWSYASIKKLYDDGILSPSEQLNPAAAENRGNFVVYLYALALKLGQPAQRSGSVPFTDVSSGGENYEAFVWAYQNDIIRGVSETAFAPDQTISRQDVCVILTRFSRHLGLLLSKKADFHQFHDSFRVSGYAKSPVAVCQMAGMINGYENGFFKPYGQITREECLTMICRLYDAARSGLSGASECVLTGEGVYDGLYSSVAGFATTLGLGEEVDKSYFDDAVFVGDSVSVMLQYYCTATKALGDAKFLCAGSLSATNALQSVTQTSVHPSYQGEKTKVEDGVAASGAKKVYMMLGINNISYGIEKATGDMVRLISAIREKAPDTVIYIQSVTPMSAASNILSNGLNNDKIQQYNSRMEELCAENGWYFVNVAEAFRDADGFLPAEYCSDYSGMGIHFTNAAVEHWIAYLKNHTSL